MEIGPYFSIMVEKNGHIDDEVSNYWKAGEGLNASDLIHEILDMGSTC
jgi:hypothetical protein